MNKIIFFFLFVLLLILPNTIDENFEEGFNFFELVTDIKNKVLTSFIEQKVEIKLTTEQLELINESNAELTRINEESAKQIALDLDTFLRDNIRQINYQIALAEWNRFRNDGGIKGIYLNGYYFNREQKLSSIENISVSTDVNTIVLDVKTDNGHLLYESTLPQVGYLNNIRVKYDASSLLEFKERNDIYLIGRVVAFQDPVFAKKTPDAAIIDVSTGLPYSQNEQYFLDPSDPKSRQYVLDVALEACNLGFDEIQFDYIRYPDTSYKGLVYDEESSFETRTKNINSFLSNAKDLLHENGCLVSADIFGYVLNARNDNGIGQYLETIIDTVDFISPMIYPSHYSKGSFGYLNPNDHPYEVITAALQLGLNRGIDPNKLRPFLQAFWHTSEDVQYNIKAAEDKQLDWILWNTISSYELDYFTKLDT